MYESLSLSAGHRYIELFLTSKTAMLPPGPPPPGVGVGRGVPHVGSIARGGGAVGAPARYPAQTTWTDTRPQIQAQVQVRDAQWECAL